MSPVYEDAFVRQRLVEFLGGSSLEEATAAYVTRSDGCGFDRRNLRPVGELQWFLERDFDIARSLADTSSLLLHLDVEYVNFDSPAEAFTDPWRSFDLQQPVVQVIERLLLEWGVRPLHLITGQGHHFVWRVPRDAGVARRITALAPAPELLDASMERVPPAFAGLIDREAERAFTALALVMEFLAHRVKEAAARVSHLPVEITAVHVGPCASAQRELISLDTSEYGDPLHTRMIRMPFTRYLKPWATGLAHSLGIENEIPIVHTIPLHEIDVRQALKVRQVEADVLDLARRACVRIPVQEAGTVRLLEDYLASPLRQFHERFYSDQHDPPDRWPETYARTPLDTLPACVRHILEWPNDLLLKPAGIQLVTRCLLAAGWHPRHIAGLIRSKFEDVSLHWSEGWTDCEPATRADFYVRLFAGTYETGLDRLVDLNCTSTREKGFCSQPPQGGCSLDPVRTTLLTRQST